MKQLISRTTAYQTFVNDARNDRLSHAYMLHFNDVDNLREALKLFALEFFKVSENSVEGRRILNETFSDLKVYPEVGKKFNAEAASALLNDCALKPLEYEKKLYIISEFNDLSALLQNKLLKTLEEPAEGVHFLLGVTTLAPVLDTVKSRVKTLTVAPFDENSIFEALERRGKNELNEAAARSCGGILGVAQNMVEGGWFSEVEAAAEEICCCNRLGDIGKVAIKYGDIKRKRELLSVMALKYHAALCERAEGGKPNKVAACWQTPTLVFAAECIDKACEDLKFNAFFQGLLFDLMLRIIEVNEKWLKLQA